MSLQLDHIGLTCGDLNAGAAAFAAMTGVDLGPGGAHPKMGTHNRLSNLGRGRYLELISINPDAAAPDFPRWFGLDNLAPDAAPALRFWMVSVPDLDAALAQARGSGVDLGGTMELSRGDLTWRVSMADGLVLNGAAPILIEWPAGVHPTQTMPPADLTLTRFVITHPDADRVAALLAALGGAPEGVEVRAGDPALRAELSCSNGRSVTLT